MTTPSDVEVVPRCECGAAIGWTRLIRDLPCAECAIEQARVKAGLESEPPKE